MSRRRARTARLAVWGRVLALFVLLAFGRAAVVPPCEAHEGTGHGGAGRGGAEHGGAEHASAPLSAAGLPSGDHQHAGEAPDGHHGSDAPHGDHCICLGDCHHAAAAAWLWSEPPRVHVAAQAFRAAPIPAARPAVSRAHQRYILPFATAPPPLGV